MGAAELSTAAAIVSGSSIPIHFGRLSPGKMPMPDRSLIVTNGRSRFAAAL